MEFLDSLYIKAVKRLENPKQSPEEMRHIWFGSDDGTLIAYNEIGDNLIGMVSADIVQSFFGAIELGWLMHEIYMEEQQEIITKKKE